MGMATVHSTHLAFQGLKYWTTNASSVVLGAYGQLRSSAFIRDRLEPMDQLSLKDVSVREATIVKIDWENSNQAAIKAQVNVAGAPAEGGVEAKVESLRTGKVVLVKLDVALGPLARALNQQDVHLQAFRAIRRTPRVVCQVFSVLEHAEANTLISGNEVFLDASAQGSVDISVGVAGGGASEHKISLSKDTTFAYLLAAPIWSPNEERVEGFDYDQWSFA